MLERTDGTTNEVLEPITFVLAHPTVQENMLKVNHLIIYYNCNSNSCWKYTFKSTLLS